MVIPMQKAASSMGETIGLGAGSGAAVGVLTALLDERPSLKRMLRNALVGAGGGAAVGAGAHALSGDRSGPDSIPTKVSGNPNQMNLGIAALSGMLPGVGPAIHGGLSQGWEQGLASGAGSVAGSLAVAVPALIKAKGVAENLPKSTHPLAAIASILGATGAAYAGNRIREGQEKAAAAGCRCADAAGGDIYTCRCFGNPMIKSKKWLQLDKAAAEIVRKTRLIEEHHDYCSHCDHEFVEKGGPRPILPDDPEERDKVFRSGDYDEQCPNCKGIVDRKELSDEEIDQICSTGFGSGDPEFQKKMRDVFFQRRDNQRRRRQEREKRASVDSDGKDTRAESPAQEKLLDAGSCCGSGCRKCPYVPRHQRGATDVDPALLKEAAKAPTEKEIVDAMTAAGLPGDVQFFVNGSRATACFGDWHEKPVWEAANKVGRKLFSQWEEPDDSEIGKPDWVEKVISSKTKAVDVIHDCVENTCPKCGKTHRPNCKDQTGDDTHKPKRKASQTCGSCANGAPPAPSNCPGCHRPFAADEPYPGVENCEVCERYGPPREKSAAALRMAVLGGVVKTASRPREERLQRLYERRGECPTCRKPNREGLVCACGKTVDDAGVEKVAAEAPGIRQARNATHIDPTPAQASAGNYAKGEFSFKGITVKIENPKGTERRGYNAAGAVTWRRVMHADYGYVKGTKAVDGDAIDVFVGPDHDSDLIVAIDQYRGDTFDETKFVVGVKTLEEGEKLYLKHYPRGWKLGPSSTTTVTQFKEWLKDGDHHKPFKGQLVKAAGLGNTVLRWTLKGLMSPAARGVMQSKPFQQAEKTIVKGVGNVADHILQHPKAYGPLFKSPIPMAVAGGIGGVAGVTSPWWGPPLLERIRTAGTSQPFHMPQSAGGLTGIPGPSGISAARG